jgi:hypothetical protein
MKALFRLFYIATICYSVSGCRQSPPPSNGRFEIHSEGYQVWQNGEEFTDHALWKIDTATGRTWIYNEDAKTNSLYVGWLEVGTRQGVFHIETNTIAAKQ